jgi:hypothetical protein
MPDHAINLTLPQPAAGAGQKDPDEQMLAAVSAIAAQAANQWAAALVDVVAQTASRQLREALKAAAIEGLSDESAALVALQMGHADALKLKVSFAPVKFFTYRTERGVVAQGAFDPSTLRVSYEGPKFSTSMAAWPEQPPIVRCTAGVPMPSPHGAQFVVHNVLPPPAVATKQHITRDKAGEIESIETVPA